MNELILIGVLKKYFDPNMYGTRDEFKNTIRETFSLVDILQINIFLEDISVDSEMSYIEKLDVYFGIYSDSENYAKSFIINKRDDILEIIRS